MWAGQRTIHRSCFCQPTVTTLIVKDADNTPLQQTASIRCCPSKTKAAAETHMSTLPAALWLGNVHVCDHMCMTIILIWIEKVKEQSPMRRMLISETALGGLHFIIILYFYPDTSLWPSKQDSLQQTSSNQLGQQKWFGPTLTSSFIFRYSPSYVCYVQQNT